MARNNHRYFALTQQEREANIVIYGDITSWPWLESDVSSWILSRQIDALDVDVINVYINSYGGEVSEGIAIYNALRRHSAKVCTIVDGFACSIASVIFMAGDERLMNDASALMVHNAWSSATGNAAQMRKAAEDLEAVNELSVRAYLSRVTIPETDLRGMMDEERWLLPEQAREMGFCTEVLEPVESLVNQSYRRNIFQRLAGLQVPGNPDSGPEPSQTPEPDDPPVLETTSKASTPKTMLTALFGGTKEKENENA